MRSKDHHPLLPARSESSLPSALFRRPPPSTPQRPTPVIHRAVPSATSLNKAFLVDMKTDRQTVKRKTVAPRRQDDDDGKLPAIHSPSARDRLLSPRSPLKRLLPGVNKAQKGKKGEVRYVTCTRTGMNHGRVKLANQDSAFAGRLEVPYSPHLLLICDGHGDCGHTVSGFLVKTFPSVVAESLKRGVEERFDTFTHALVETYRRTNEALKHSAINARCSGSTCVCVLVLPDRIICGNVGDSRAVLGRKLGEVLPLSRDHKPENIEERERIEAAGGRVAPMKKQPHGSMRIWFQDDEAPGLAVSRVLGDFAAQKIGVIATPEVTSTPITDRDLFVILASDGLWEYVSDEEAVSLVHSLVVEGRQRESASLLVEEAAKRWLSHETRVDDITVIVAFLD